MSDYDDYTWVNANEVLTVADHEGVLIAFGIPPRDPEPKQEPGHEPSTPVTRNGFPAPGYNTGVLPEPEHRTRKIGGQAVCLGCQWIQLRNRIQKAQASDEE